MAARQAGFGGALRAWKRTYLAAARADGFRTLLERHHYDPDSDRGHGEQFVERLGEVLAYALAARSLDQPLEDDAVRRFLDAQAYGAGPGAGYSIRLGPPPEAELFVEELHDLDLQDLFDGLEPFDLTVTWLGEPLGATDAAALEEAVLADITYDGDTFDAQWETEGVRLVVRRTWDEE